MVFFYVCISVSTKTLEWFLEHRKSHGKEVIGNVSAKENIEAYGYVRL
jgi:hypothetical protein